MSIASTLPNTAQITSQIAGLPDAALQQMAQMHKQDPYVLPLIVSESQRRKQLRAQAQAQNTMQMGQPPKVVDQAIAQMSPPAQPAPPMPSRAQMAQQLPENQGIATLPSAQNTEYAAEGGIIGYSSGGGVSAEEKEKYKAYAVQKAKEYGINPEIALRLFQQESGWNPKAVSKKGARGIGQIMPDTGKKDLGLKDEDFTDPYKNIDASLRYFSRLQNKYGDAAKAAAAYNWGQGNVDRHLANNNGDLDPSRMPDETANYLTKVIAPGSALTAKGPESQDSLEARVSRIPGGVPQAAYEEPKFTGAERIVGGLEAAGTMLSGAVSPVTGLGRSTAKWFETGEFPPVDESAVAMTYSPRTAAGQATIGSVAQAADDLKLPPYIPGLGRVPKRAPSAVAAQADEAAATAKVATPRLLPPGATAETQQAGLAALKADQAAAAAKAAKTVTASADDIRLQRITDNANQAIDRAGPGMSKVGRATQMAGEAGPPSGTAAEEPFDDWATAGTYLTDKDEKKIQDLGEKGIKAANPDADTSKFSGEDLLMFGLQMMAGKSQYALQNIGEAGIATLKSRAERKKADSEAEYTKAKTQEAKATAEYTQQFKGVAAAEKMVNDAYNKWASSSVGLQALLQDPGAGERKKREIAADVYKRMGLDTSGSSSFGVGLPYSEADTALVNKYLNKP